MVVIRKIAILFLASLGFYTSIEASDEFPFGDGEGGGVIGLLSSSGHYFDESMINNIHSLPTPLPQILAVAATAAVAQALNDLVATHEFIQAPPPPDPVGWRLTRSLSCPSPNKVSGLSRMALGEAEVEYSPTAVSRKLYKVVPPPGLSPSGASVASKGHKGIPIEGAVAPVKELLIEGGSATPLQSIGILSGDMSSSLAVHEGAVSPDWGEFSNSQGAPLSYATSPDSASFIGGVRPLVTDAGNSLEEETDGEDIDGLCKKIKELSPKLAERPTGGYSSHDAVAGLKAMIAQIRASLEGGDVSGMPTPGENAMPAPQLKALAVRRGEVDTGLASVNEPTALVNTPPHLRAKAAYDIVGGEADVAVDEAAAEALAIVKYMGTTEADGSSLKLPRGLNHIAFICDGNRRWATSQGKSKLEGHRAGIIENTIRVAQHIFNLGAHTLTVWWFSPGNWKREADEIANIMHCLEELIPIAIEQAKIYEARIIHLGNKTRLPASLIAALEAAEASTISYKKHTLNLAIDYGGHNDVARAVKKQAERGINFAELTDEEVEDAITSEVDTKGQRYPNPDLMIRTAGESRTSGFMEWQSEAGHTELYVTEEYFPAVDYATLLRAIGEYAKRKRTFSL